MYLVTSADINLGWLCVLVGRYGFRGFVVDSDILGMWCLALQNIQVLCLQQDSVPWPLRTEKGLNIWPVIDRSAHEGSLKMTLMVLDNVLLCHKITVTNVDVNYKTERAR